MGSLQYWLIYWSEWSDRFWPQFLDHLWQATLFVGLAIIAVQLLRQAPARARYGVWLIALLKFTLPTALLLQLFPQVALIMPSPVSSWLWPNSAAPVGGEAVALSGPGRFFFVLTTLWVVGGIIILARWLRRYERFSRAVAGETPVKGGREVEVMERARALLGLKDSVSLILSRQFPEPVVWGVRDPVVILPEKMALHLSDDELMAVMLHELTHIKRRDNFFGNLTMLLCCAVWFHPLVWWLDRRLLAEREKACDDHVLNILDGSKAYAAGLLKIVRFRLGWSIAGIAGAGDSHLGQRIKRILTGGARQPLSVWHRAVLGLMAAALLMLSWAAESRLHGRQGGFHLWSGTPQSQQLRFTTPEDSSAAGPVGSAKEEKKCSWSE